MDNMKTERIKWSDEYSVGIQLIDDQHKELINLTNNLYNHVTGNKEEERAYFDKVIQYVLDYVKNHFVTEEQCMLATNYSGYSEHKHRHDEFTFSVIKSINEINTGKVLALEKFADYLKEWILTHIAVMDKQYNLYFKKTAAIGKDGKLSVVLANIINNNKSLLSK